MGILTYLILMCLLPYFSQWQEWWHHLVLAPLPAWLQIHPSPRRKSGQGQCCLCYDPGSTIKRKQRHEIHVAYNWTNISPYISWKFCSSASLYHDLFCRMYSVLISITLGFCKIKYSSRANNIHVHFNKIKRIVLYTLYRPVDSLHILDLWRLHQCSSLGYLREGVVQGYIMIFFFMFMPRFCFYYIL